MSFSLPTPTPCAPPAHPSFSTAPAVSIEGLSFFYANAEPALENISLTLQSGDFLAVIGPNGGGKTTLLRLILGLLQPQCGSVAVFGSPPTDMSRRIGYVPQFSTMQLDFPASVLDVTLMGGACATLRAGGWPTDKKTKQKALTYLDILGLADCAGLPVGSLSGGQRQRALVARALMGRPERFMPAPASTAGNFAGHDASFLLLLDEPTASIDPQGKFCFYEFIGKLRGTVSVIVVSHDLFMVSPFFNSIVFVNKTLTPLADSTLSPENLTTLFGPHLHDCPVADMQHADGAAHHDGCTHPACATTDATENADHAAAPAPPKARQSCSCEHVVEGEH